MATRSINVKIPTAKVIAALEDKLNTLIKEKENYPAARERYEQDYELWKRELASMVDTSKIKDVGVTNLTWRSPGEYEVAISYKVKAESIPPAPEAPTNPGYREREAIENIENALRILRLTEQEEVSTSTYNAIAQYL